MYHHASNCRGGAKCKPFSAHSGGGQEGVGRSASSSAPGARVHGRSVGRSGSVGGRADRVGRSVVPGREPESKHGRSVEGFRSVGGEFFFDFGAVWLLRCGTSYRHVRKFFLFVFQDLHVWGIFLTVFSARFIGHRHLFFRRRLANATCGGRWRTILFYQTINRRIDDNVILNK